MVNLSQILGKEIRKIIPFYFQNNEGQLVEEKIIIKNPTKEQIEELRDIYETKEKADDEYTDEDLFFTMLEMFIKDLNIDKSREEFFESMKYFSEVLEVIKLEFDSILYEIVITGYERIEQLINMPEEKRIKILATSPELKEMYLKVLSQREEISKDNEEELRKQKEEEEKEKERQALKKRLKELGE